MTAPDPTTADAEKCDWETWINSPFYGPVKTVCYQKRGHLGLHDHCAERPPAPTPAGSEGRELGKLVYSIEPGDTPPAREELLRAEQLCDLASQLAAAKEEIAGLKSEYALLRKELEREREAANARIAKMREALEVVAEASSLYRCRHEARVALADDEKTP